MVTERELRFDTKRSGIRLVCPVSSSQEFGILLQSLVSSCQGGSMTTLAGYGLRRLKSNLAMRWVTRSASNVSCRTRVFVSRLVDATMARFNCNNGLSVSSLPRRSVSHCLRVKLSEKLFVSLNTTLVSTGALFLLFACMNVLGTCLALPFPLSGISHWIGTLYSSNDCDAACSNA